MPLPSSDFVVEAQNNVLEEVSEQQKKVTPELGIQGEPTVEGCSNLPPSAYGFRELRWSEGEEGETARPSHRSHRENPPIHLPSTFQTHALLGPPPSPLDLPSPPRLQRIPRALSPAILPIDHHLTTISLYHLLRSRERSVRWRGGTTTMEFRSRGCLSYLAIVSGIEPPVGSFYDDSGAYLLPLVDPSDHELDVVCILEGGEDPVDWRDEDNLDQLVENLEQDEDLWEEALDDVRDEFKVDFGHPRSMDELNWLGEILEVPSLDSEIQERLCTRNIHRIVAEHRAFFKTLVEGLRPSALRLPADALRPDFPNNEDEPTTMDTTLLQIYQPSSPSKQSSSADLFRIVVLLLWTFAIRRIRLEGFDPSFLAELTGCIKANLESDEPSPASTSPHSFVTWSWELEDGNLFSLSARPTADAAV